MSSRTRAKETTISIDETTYCIYCGRPRPETFDHIPPRCIFPSPRPDNLVKVPCCLKCNVEASRDDEYFKNSLALRHDVTAHPVGSKLVASTLRALARPQSRGMLNTLGQSMRRIPVHTPAGLYIGQAGTFDVDLTRLGRVTNRIVKGLFFEEFHRRLPQTHDVRSFAESGLRDINSEQRADLSRIIASILGGDHRMSGENVFEYWFKVTPEDVDTTAWLFRFFGVESFFCVTAPVESSTTQINPKHMLSQER